MIRVDVKPEMLRWARERAGMSISDLSRRFAGLPRWERAEAKPTLKQLEGFAKATYTPVGFLFLDKPPDESLPLPDMRTGGNKPIVRPSPNLLEMVYLCQQPAPWS
jgi:transcriptional regulator with XRE-family HTH domain